MDNPNLEVLFESLKINSPKINGINNVIDALQFLSFMDSINESTSITEKSTSKFYTKYAINKIKESLIEENKFVWPYSVSPYFTPEEVSQFRGYYAEDAYVYDYRSINYNIDKLKNMLRNTEDPDEIADIKSKMDALSNFSGEANDFYDEATATQFNPRSWNKKMITLTTKLKSEEDPEQIDYLKQEIINLGWNPEVDYTAENQIRAKKRIETIYQEKYKNIFSLNLTSLVEASNIGNEIIYEASNDKTKPIHVIVVKGDSTFSDVITKVTKSQFSHSAICIDNDFNNLYSFNLVNGINKVGGFSVERIDEYPKENRLAVFSFFVSKDTHKKISERIKLLADNISNTAYGVFNILTLPFKHINLNFDNSMICSQFVDSIIKMANIDITGKDSSHVVPNDFYKAGTVSGKIYKVFDGIIKDFNPKKIISYVNKMSNKIKPSITEGTINELLADFVYPTVMEAKFPIEVTKDKDIIITNKFVDFDREYSASHKLLLQYSKGGNVDGIKYELARLYYMNYILERRLYHNKYLSNKEKNIKTRARVLNDFNKYFKYVLEKEPDFNFSEYYEKSIFYPHTIEVKSDTIITLKDIINYIL